MNARTTIASNGSGRAQAARSPLPVPAIYGEDQAQSALAVLEAAKQRVAKARAAADSSLLKAKSAPPPHEIGNPLFVTLFEKHQNDREILFAAMRALERARAEAGRSGEE
jgi:hypothetical protein